MPTHSQIDKHKININLQYFHFKVNLIFRLPELMIFVHMMLLKN
ncbi:hypothetical protein [Simonsiella muelleri]|nr:hypothetical protein [Simonsiella muelleri]